jgi:mannose-1-phosphate guanylyltransferase
LLNERGMEAHRWAILLAGGEGVRLRPYVQRRFGEPRPKQYCDFYGGRSLLQHTLERAAGLVAPERTVTVIASAHERWARPQLAGHAGRVVCQAINRETAPGLFLPLAYVRARDPGAIVYILPSDHYVRPADRFVAAVAAAGDLAARHRDRIVLTGVVPEAAEIEYGYIEPGEAIDPIGTTRRVRRFVEKPTAAEATDAIARGAVWNTMVIAASVDALWTAGTECLPEVMSLFGQLVEAIDTPFERSVLETIYFGMPVANFSRDVLERVADRCLVTRLDAIEWSDWGAAERIEASIARQARRPALPAPAAPPDALVAT